MTVRAVRPSSTRTLGKIVLLAILLFAILAAIAYWPQWWGWVQAQVREPLPTVETLEIQPANLQSELANRAAAANMTVDQFIQSPEFAEYQKSFAALSAGSGVVPVMSSDAPVQTGASAEAYSGAAPEAQSGFTFWLGWADLYLEVPQGANVPQPFGPLGAHELGGCDGELTSNCVATGREKNEQNIARFYYGKNPTNCWQDGYMLVNGEMVSYVAPGEIGFTQGMTIRRCELYNQPKDAWRVSQNGQPPVGPATRHLQTFAPVSYGVVQQPPTYTGGEVYNPNPQQPPQGGLIGLGVVLANGVEGPINVRYGPGCEHAGFAGFSRGQTATILEQSSDGYWLKVKIGTTEGWIAGWLTTANTPMGPNCVAQAPASPASPQPAATPVPSQTGGSTGGATSPSVTIHSGTVAWTQDGELWLWNTYKNPSNGGKPVDMTLECEMDGEYLLADGTGDSPIPPGRHQVTGITAKVCE